jgi:poly(3-hydroxybutyrate) depolymerase
MEYIYYTHQNSGGYMPMSDPVKPVSGVKGTVQKIVLGGVIVAASIGGSVAVNQNPPTSTAINATSEMAIYQSNIVEGLEGVGMVSGEPPHIHLTWNNIPNSKGFNVYVDGKKVTTSPIRVTTDQVHYTLDQGLVAGQTYNVTATVYGKDGKESAQSKAVSISIPLK